SAYHLFYADKIGSPGTDITFFDWPMAGPKESGTDTIATTMFRVPSRDSLGYWAERLSKFKVLSSIESYGPFDVVRFDDPEGLQLALINDAQAPFEGQVWDQSNVPAEHA